ncbi:hypothetical protein J3R30DRAFT_3423083 [Lentinula aciculospora]|uniref:Uncharacterized protein n=1 Tax=Lentinula aciculospora TaxID=153920 RepID=A0A9W9AWQ2_9AGAR|nr:hypothetical protein J3R30DRAFT_3423083 [Lentinula aciculospora]
MAFSIEPFSKTLELPLFSGQQPQEVAAVLVPLPKNTTATVFGQRIALWPQRFSTYLLDSNELVVNPQAIWDAPTESSSFSITGIVPSGFAPDTRVLSVGPFTSERYIAVVCSHKRVGQSDYTSSAPQHSFKSFDIKGQNAMSFTMVNAEDGGDSDFHDTVVGVAVTYTTKRRN